jgi:hypothetical protein
MFALFLLLGFMFVYMYKERVKLYFLAFFCRLLLGTDISKDIFFLLQLCIAIYNFILLLLNIMTTSVVWWSEFLATDPEVPGSIPGATRFSEK